MNTDLKEICELYNIFEIIKILLNAIIDNNNDKKQSFYINFSFSIKNCIIVFKRLGLYINYN